MKAGIQELLHDEVEEQFEQLKQKKRKRRRKFRRYLPWGYFTFSVIILR